MDQKEVKKKKLEVKLAYLQAALSLPKLLASEMTLSAEKVKGLKSMELTSAPDGLMVVLEKGRAWIPAANVKGVALVD